MTEEYIQSLRKQLQGFPAEEQDALIEEIRSHIESGEEDPKLGKDADQRRKRMLDELGSPKDLGRNFKTIYHPNGLIDFLLIFVPYLFYPLLNNFYNNLLPVYQWADVRLDILIHLPLIAIGLWRKSAALTLFWVIVILNQLFFIVLQTNGYYGIQSIIWALLLLALLALAGYVIWKYKNDLQILTFGLMPLTMCVLGNVLSTLNLTDYSLGTVSRSLVLIYSYVNSLASYGLMAAMALFFLPTNRQVRWLGLVLYALVLGLNHEYLNNVFAGWAYSLWLILPLAIVLTGWGVEQIRKPKLEVAAS
jgi:hypothetical protein